MRTAMKRSDWPDKSVRLIAMCVVLLGASSLLSQPSDIRPVQDVLLETPSGGLEAVPSAAVVSLPKIRTYEVSVTFERAGLRAPFQEQQWVVVYTREKVANGADCSRENCWKPIFQFTSRLRPAKRVLTRFSGEVLIASWRTDLSKNMTCNVVGNMTTERLVNARRVKFESAAVDIRPIR
jgi:hypothetical protein